MHGKLTEVEGSCPCPTDNGQKLTKSLPVARKVHGSCRKVSRWYRKLTEVDVRAAVCIEY